MDIITLAGPRGTGKTTIGKKLATNLGYKFVELDRFMDKVLEEHSGSIEYAKKFGWDEWMKQVHKCVREVLKIYKDKKIVFEVGYGSIYSQFPESEKVAKLLREKTKLFLILPSEDEEASIEILFKRERKRKMWESWSDDKLRRKIREDYLERVSGMKDVVHHTFHVEGDMPEIAARKIEKLIVSG